MRPRLQAPHGAFIFSLAILFFSGGATGCLLFTDTFNRPPHVELTGPSTLFRSQQGTFTAVVSDDDRTGMIVDWAVSTTCPANLAAAELVVARERDPGNGDQKTFTRPVAGTECLYVVVTDKAGARAFASKTITVRTRELVIQGPASVAADQEATFTASFSDDPNAAGRAKFSWAFAKGRSCEAASTAAHVNKPTDRAAFTSTAPRSAFCVAVYVIDEFGADMTATKQVMVPGAPPEIHIVQPSPASNELGLFAPVRLSGIDPDEDSSNAPAREFEWTVIKPGGQKLTAVEMVCLAPTRGEICFESALAGMYHVELSVTEEGKALSATPLELTVADRPPCIRLTEPNFLTSPRVRDDYDKARTFKVIEVQDDADPLPAGPRPNQGEFTWSVQKENEGLRRRVGWNFSELTLGEKENQLGDTVKVRVEYRDRVDRNRVRPEYASRCDPMKNDVCELVPGSGCFQWITWTVVYY